MLSSALSILQQKMHITLKNFTKFRSENQKSNKTGLLV